MWLMIYLRKMEKTVEPKIVWEDEEIAVLDKPAGMVSTRSGSVREITVQDWVEEKINLDFKKREGGGSEMEMEEFVNRSGLAHRLDKETSGCLLVAKNAVSLSRLMAQFKKRKIDKEYVSLLHGEMEPGEGRIRLPMARAEGYRQEIRFDGKTADTEWRVEKRYEGMSDDRWKGMGQWGESLSLVNLKIYTGRMHQIRVHMAHLGYPVFGDSRYLNKKQSEMDRLILRRHFLHSRKIIFELKNGQRQEVVAEIGEDLEKVLGKLVSR